MAEVKAFRGLRYNKDKSGGTFADLVCPPYDVISSEAQQGYLAKSPYNVIRLELGQTLDSDDTSNNRYTRAAALLIEWQQQGVLLQEVQPGYYLYEQEFEIQGQSYKRRALLSAVRLHEWDEGVILPHEHTLAKPKADRLALLEATQTNLSPIFCVYKDTDGKVETITSPQNDTKLLYEFSDNGETQRLWLIDEPEKVSAIEQEFADKKLYIADGHHRYETALAYRQERRKQGDAEGGPADYILMALTALEDEGLVVLPYHRQVFGLSEDMLQALEGNLSQYFGVEEVSVQDEAHKGTFMSDVIQNLNNSDKTERERNHVYGMYGAESEHLTILKLKNEESVTELMPPHSEAWQKLDVSIFQTVVLEGCLGMTEDSIADEENLSYTREVEAAVAKVERGEVQRLFLLPSTRVEDMLAVADAHDQMPPKSTYFYPKFLTGIVMRRLD